ncbi:hypothetical protein ETU10_06375 [Apibacter muscae]|uniref:hypothetical protein n=1 Tax=Apibacter muscae TaxID=2509004 RepID=UPI0011AD9045|nr:hypothetical protein [Apibacter muscae]TWP23854.1 hypothetical protein ETU10_06375 [Apibacter muscae]
MGFLDKIFGKKKKDEILDWNIVNQEEDQSVIFVEKFKSAGGMFFYNDDESEALQTLKNILIVEDISEVLCLNPKLISMLNVLDCNNTPICNGKQDIAFINCEYLVTLDGSVMVSSDQISHLKKSDLPNKIIVWASPDQIISSSSEGLEKIRVSKKQKLPSNITTIHGNQVQGFSGLSTTRKLYLLLVEESYIA